MSLQWAITRKVLFALVAVWLVVSVAFMFVLLRPDPRIAMIAYSCGGDDECFDERVGEYREEHGLDDPVLVRYGRWLVGIVTLDWGDSIRRRQPVTDLIADAAPYTLLYVIPAVLFSTILGIGLGAYLAVRDRPWLDRSSSMLSYFLFGIPNFYLVFPLGLLFGLGSCGGTTASIVGGNVFSLATLESFMYPAAILSTTLLAGQLQFARSESLEHAGSEFVKLARAKGAGRLRVIRHVLRNAAIPLSSLVVTEMIGVLIVQIYILEEVFCIPGIGTLSYFAFQEQDGPLIVGTTMFVAVLGIAALLLQDVATLLLDPRIEDET